jgi:hypothetical protein
VTGRISRGITLREYRWALSAVLLIAAASRGDGDPSSAASRPADQPAQAANTPSKGTTGDPAPPTTQQGANAPKDTNQATALVLAGGTMSKQDENGIALNPDSLRALRELQAALHETEPAGEPEFSQPDIRPLPFQLDLDPPADAPRPNAAQAPGQAQAQAQAPAQAQTAAPTQVPAAPTAKPSAPETVASKLDVYVQQAECATCGGGQFGGPLMPTMPGSAIIGPEGCANGSCVPGRPPCYPLPEPCTFIGYFINDLYQCLCCPDPCYEPKWVPEANAAFGQDYARTRTVTRIRFDRGLDMQFPDRNEFFYKHTILGHFGSSSHHFIVNGIPYRADPNLNFNQLYFYQEIAAGKASFFVEVPPYRQIKPLFGTSAAGFSDMNLGAKSLEPSLLTSIRLAPQTYFQGQLAQWIPLGGTNGFAGGILHYHFSLNQTLLRVTPDSPLIATFEANGWSFQNGGYTNPIAGPHQPARIGSGGETYFTMGPGLRQSVCNGVDFGGAVTWPVTSGHWADPLFRVEMRILF